MSERLEAERLRMFRRHLAILIGDLSPVVLDLADLLGAGIDEVAAGFRPQPQWPAMNEVLAGGGCDPDPHPRRRAHMGADAPVRLARRDDRDGASVTCSFTLLAGRIEAITVLGDVPIQTCGDRVSVLLPRSPDVAALAVGSSADLPHAPDLLVGRGYVVETIDDRFVCDRMLITLRTGMREHLLHFTGLGEELEGTA